jgi:hypothetical protein
MRETMRALLRGFIAGFGFALGASVAGTLIGYTIGKIGERQLVRIFSALPETSSPSPSSAQPSSEQPASDDRPETCLCRGPKEPHQLYSYGCVGPIQHNPDYVPGTVTMPLAPELVLPDDAPDDDQDDGSDYFRALDRHDKQSDGEA